MSEVTIADLIGNAADQSPEAFRQTFDQLMHDRVVAALDTRKQEVAAKYFDQSADEEQDDETLETGETDGQDAETDA